MTSFAEFDLASITPLPEVFASEDVNARLDAIQSNVQFLSAVMQTAREASALIGFNAPLAADYAVGTPVYWDKASGTFKASALLLTLSGGRYLASASSECWGLVWKKCATNKAHLLLDGIAAIDMTAPTGSANPDGKWYLSTDAGRLVSSPGGTLICPVLWGMGDGKVLFRPWFADNFPRFFPQVFELSTAIAGTLTSSGTTSSITAANNSVPGWLPAGNSIFGGSKPSGAIFGYNWKKDPNLADIWPPVYPGEAELVLDSGGSTSQGGRVILNDSSRCIIDESGIWWMSNCTGQLPWDIPAQGATGSITCPKSLPRKLWLKASYGPGGLSNTTAVNSLKSKTDWLKITKRDTAIAASTGHLDIEVDTDNLVNLTAGNTSGIALKTFADGKFQGGPAVVSLKSNSPSLQISGGTELSAGGPQYGQLTLSLTASKDFDLLPLRTSLHNATTQAYGETMAIGLRAGSPSSFVTEFHVPAAVASGSKVKFKIWLLAPSTLVIPAGITLEVYRIAAPLETPGTLPAYSSVSFTYPSGDTLEAEKYVAGESASVDVAGGDTIYIRITRSGDSDGVSADLHVLKLYGVFL